LCHPLLPGHHSRISEKRNAPKDFKKAATLKDVLPSDPFLDDED
jgi:hypothetical protein